ncbi:MAG: trimethylamine methyltransferase family protein [Actinomycetes bacterium]
MRPQVSWTTAEERRLIVDQALALLETVGMRFGACASLQRLADAGARVDRETGVARLPRELVERALAGCPHEVLLAGATTEQDLVLDGSAVHFLPSGTPTRILDDETGLVRSSTTDDLRRAAIVADAMPVVDIMWPPVGAADVPEDEMELTELLTVLEWSGKHLQHEVTAPWHVAAMLESMSELCGGLDAYCARPRVSFVCCTHSPLGVGGAFLDVNIEMARHGGPILVYPMPIAGATAPMSVAGAVTMNVAEFLAVATAIQMAAPGAPLIMGAGAGLLDMKAGAFSFGALETALMCAACVEVGHELGVPVLAPGLATDALHGGVQAGYEKALKGLAVAQSGADLITGGIGQLHGAGLFSLPQVVIDAEIATMITRLLAGAEVSPSSIMSEVTARVGFDGDFLRQKETSRRLRAGEVFLPEVASRVTVAAWEAGGRDELDAARERAHELIVAAEARGPLLPEGVRETLRAIAADALAEARAAQGG